MSVPSVVRKRPPATAAALAAVEPSALLAAQAEVTRGGNPLTGRNAFQIVVDGDLLPRDPAEALLEEAEHGRRAALDAFRDAGGARLLGA